MIVGIDYTAAAWQGAGIGRYTRELVRATVALDTRRSYRLFYAAGGLPPDSLYVKELRQLCAEHSHVRALPIPLSPKTLTRLWQRLRLPLPVELFTGRLDILHAPDYALPPTRARTLVTVHDLAFLIDPTWFVPAFPPYMNQAVPRALRRADLVLADSYATRDDLVRLLRADPAKITVIHLGVDPRFRPLPAAEIEPVRQRLGLPPHFALFVSTLEPRKNVVRLLEAFALLPGLLPSSDLHLVVAGRKGWRYEPIFEAVERLRLEQRVFFMDFLDDKDLPAMYNLAEVFVYPPLYEGFGLPDLEALACGTPVVTSAVASLPEVVGDTAVLVDPNDSASIARGIARVINDTGLAQRLRAAGPERARPFTWEQAGREVLACYDRLGPRTGDGRPKTGE